MPRVLVVDDDIDFLEQMTLMLKGHGYDVVAAGSQEDATKLIEEERFDIAVFDLMLENMDGGFVLSHQVKKKDASVPVIMVTNVTGETGMVFEAGKGGSDSWVKADAVLAKPVRYEQLQREIERLTRKKKDGEPADTGR